MSLKNIRKKNIKNINVVLGPKMTPGRIKTGTILLYLTFLSYNENIIAIIDNNPLVCELGKKPPFLKTS
ncbi:hypothetical protein MACH09_01580 [Vibrio sp. MACH09]|nr:hypothetical protein MACH09_01580 [Vibrio sp. MACH09]